MLCATHIISTLLSPPGSKTEHGSSKLCLSIAVKLQALSLRPSQGTLLSGSSSRHSMASSVVLRPAAKRKYYREYREDGKYFKIVGFNMIKIKEKKQQSSNPHGKANARKKQLKPG